MKRYKIVCESEWQPSHHDTYARELYGENRVTSGFRPLEQK
jgi:hypothetical protein